MDNNSEVKIIKFEDGTLESVSGGIDNKVSNATYYIDDDWCIRCGECERQCPACAIKEGADGSYAIDSYICVGCGFCEYVCPVQHAIRTI